MLEKYSAIFKEQLENGIIEKVNSTDSSSGIIHYIPHHPILTPEKATTKVRVVFDASAKYQKEQSLNDLLYKGSSLLKDLCGILIRFRLMEKVIIADVEKAFHQIGLNEEDRNTTRFLWAKDYHKEISPSNVEIYRFKCIPFGVISSPFLLAATLEHHLTTIGSELSLRILQNIYVDNVIVEINEKEETGNLYQAIKELFRSAKMNIREFFSNDE